MCIYKKLVIEQLGRGLGCISKFDRDQKLENQKKWLKANNYGRQQATEITFSTFKRVFGDGAHISTSFNIGY